MTRDEAMRAVVEAARRVFAVGRFEDRVALRGTLDRLDAIPGEPGLPAICEYCGEVKAWNGEAWVGHCHEAPAPEQKTVRVLGVELKREDVCFDEVEQRMHYSWIGHTPMGRACIQDGNSVGEYTATCMVVGQRGSNIFLGMDHASVEAAAKVIEDFFIGLVKVAKGVDLG